MLNFEQYAAADALAQPATLMTIVTESLLQDSVIRLLKSLHVDNYVISSVQGEGQRSRPLEQLVPRTLEAEASATQLEQSVPVQVEIRAIVSQELSNVILYALREQQRNFAIIAYRQKVEALID